MNQPSYTYLFAYLILGFYSWRNTTAGSWFMQALCHVLQRQGRFFFFQYLFLRYIIFLSILFFNFRKYSWSIVKYDTSSQEGGFWFPIQYSRRLYDAWEKADTMYHIYAYPRYHFYTKIVISMISLHFYFDLSLVSILILISPPRHLDNKTSIYKM